VDKVLTGLTIATLATAFAGWAIPKLFGSSDEEEERSKKTERKQTQ